MRVSDTRISGVHIVELDAHVDHRGSFHRLYCSRELIDIIGGREIEQINQSRTRKVGAVRGMHFQYSPHSEMKLVRCVSGRVWDVAVDLRADSPTFLRWHAAELTPENALLMVIPEGCAHGFQVLEPDTELLYLHTALYEPTAEGGVRPTDPMLSIDWPLQVDDLSRRDLNHPLLTPHFPGIAS